MRRKLVQTLHLLAHRRHSTGMGNLDDAPEIAGAFQVDEARRIVRLIFSKDFHPRIN
jgi:hypothetical protein